MKFAEHLSAHITPEWRKQYIQYEVNCYSFFVEIIVYKQIAVEQREWFGSMKQFVFAELRFSKLSYISVEDYCLGVCVCKLWWHKILRMNVIWVVTYLHLYRITREGHYRGHLPSSEILSDTTNCSTKLWFYPYAWVWVKCIPTCMQEIGSLTSLCRSQLPTSEILIVIQIGSTNEN